MPDSNLTGMVGHFMAAVMETAGLYAQSVVLSEMTDVLLAIAALLYTWYLIAAIFAVALYGDYKKAGFFLIGPAIFYWLICDTVPVTGVRSQYGVRIVDQEAQKRFLASATSKTRHQGEAEISRFYKIYNDLLSDTIQTLVAFLIDTEENEDLIRDAREDIWRRIAKQESDNETYLRLVSTYTIGQCGQMARIAWEMSREMLADSEDDTAARAKYDELRKDYNQIRHSQKVRFDSADASMQKYLEYVVAWAKQNGYPINGLRPDTILNDNGKQGRAVSCDEIWQYTRLAAMRVASTLLNPTEEEKKKFSSLTDEQWDEVRKFVEIKLIDPEKTNPDDQPARTAKAIEVLGAFFLKNTLAHTPHGALTSNMGSRQVFLPQMTTLLYGERAYQEGLGERFKAVTFITAVPYLQGMLLYILSLCFPFFCVFLLVPQRISAFFVWMGLELWVRSWDVGFALVNLTKELLWQMMPNVGKVRSINGFSALDLGDPENLQAGDPATILNIVYMNDPTDHIATYYQVVVILMAAVPLLSAHMCLGATHLYEFFSHGVDQNAMRFGSAKARKARRYLANDQNTNLREDGAAARMDAVLDAIRNPGRNAAGGLRNRLGDASTANYAEGKGNEAATKRAYAMHYQQAALAAVSGRAMPIRADGDMTAGEIGNFIYNELMDPLTGPSSVMSSQSPDRGNPNAGDRGPQSRGQGRSIEVTPAAGGEDGD